MGTEVGINAITADFLASVYAIFFLQDIHHAPEVVSLNGSTPEIPS